MYNEIMETEIEAKFLNIDPAQLRIKLQALGATQEHPEKLMKRKTFDDRDGRLNKVGWMTGHFTGQKR